MPTYPPYPKFNLHDPCAQDPANLITNGSMGPDHHDHAWGTVVDGWDPFVMSGEPPNYRWEDNEMIDPGGAQQLYTENTFDAGVYQVVKNLQPGASYMIRWGYSLAAKSGGGYPVGNTRVNSIGRQLGIDPYGKTDPHSANVIWGQAFFEGKPAVNLPAMQAIFVAQAAQATIYLRAIAQEGGNGENRVWIDAICMEARGEIPAQPVTPIKPPPPPIVQPDPAAQSAQNAAVAHKPWMPINDTAALYKFALKNELGYPQTDEFEFQMGADGYIGQVFNLGIVYVKKGDWGNVMWVKKPDGV